MATKQLPPQASGHGIADIFLQGFIALLLLILVFLQYRLWAGDIVLRKLRHLKLRLLSSRKMLNLPRIMIVL